MHNAHALIINLNMRLEEPYTVGAFSIVRSLSQHNIKTSYFDNNEVEINLNDKENHSLIFNLIAEKVTPETQFIGFSTINANSDVSLDCAKFLKEKFPQISIGFGGVFFGSNPNFENYKEKLEEFDFYIAGRGDQIIEKIIAWQFDPRNFKPTKGLSYKSDDQFHHSTERLTYEDYKPISYMPKGNDLNYAETSFSVGCPYRCSFCNQHFHYPNFIRSDVEECIDELRQHKGKRVFFTDALINNNHTWLKNLCKRMIEEKLNIQWFSWFRTSRQMNDREMLDLLYESGCRALSFGLESASSSVLKHMKKFNDEKQIYQIFDKVRDINKEGKNFVIKLNIIAGYPTETEEDFKKTYYFLKKNSDVISEISICPALMNMELKDFQKLEESGELIYVRNQHDWATEHSTPLIRVERLARLRKFLETTNIHYAIHFEEQLKKVAFQSNSSDEIKAIEPNPWKRTFYSYFLDNNIYRNNEFYLFPNLQDITDHFDYDIERAVIITSAPTLFNKIVGGSNHEKFAVTRFMENLTREGKYKVIREPVNLLLFLLLKRNLLGKGAKKLNSYIGPWFPWLSFHTYYEVTKVKKD